ncbi:hypothetical protein E4U17_003427 [Claviceps sp. LM77 group G4]|nr:hypothetical protein E4U17_003427 [Claviceps sp. LM77 group G4]
MPEAAPRLGIQRSTPPQLKVSNVPVPPHPRAPLPRILIIVTRSHKANDRDRKGSAEGTSPSETLPRYFGKTGFSDGDPKKVKKDGNGRGNWGTIADDVMDEDFKFSNARRRSNSSTVSHHVTDFKTKFEVVDTEPVFEESIHGPIIEPIEPDDTLSKTDSSESGRSAP